MAKLTEWNPFGISRWDEPPRSWAELMNRYFAPASAEGTEGMRWFPKVDVKETSDAYHFSMEAPGLKPEDVDISFTGDTLTIRGERRQEERRQGEQWHVTERSYGAFQRGFTIPGAVDPNQIEADLRNGVLEVKVKKSEKAQPRSIKIRGG